MRYYGNRATAILVLVLVLVLGLRATKLRKVNEMATVVRQKHSPTKFAPTDWKTSNFVVASSAERQRSTAHDIRQQSQRLRNETGV